MLSPRFKREITRGIERIIWDLQDEVVEILAEELTGSMTKRPQITTSFWFEGKLIQKRITQALHKKTGISKRAIKRAFKEAQKEQAKYDGRIYGKKVKLTAEMAAIVQAQYEMTLKEFRNYTRSTVRAACTEYYTVLDKAHNQVISGLKPWGQAFMDAVDQLGEGVTIEYDSGRKTTPEVAIARSLRTGLAQMASQITATRAVENDVHLFLTSAHSGARPEHEPWQGRVFWVDWQELAKRIPIKLPKTVPEATEHEKSKYPEFCKTTDIGSVTGLEGANCRHSYGPFFEGCTNPYAGRTYDKTMYDKEQKARGMERSLRKRKHQLKAEQAALRQLPDGDLKIQMQDRIKSNKAKMKKKVTAYYDYCNSNGIKIPQEFRLYIGR